MCLWECRARLQGLADWPEAGPHLAANLMLRLSMAALQISTVLHCVISVSAHLTQLSLQVPFLHTPLQDNIPTVLAHLPCARINQAGNRSQDRRRREGRGEGQDQDRLFLPATKAEPVCCIVQPVHDCQTECCTLPNMCGSNAA